jgi:hypothetical protein
VNDHDSYWERRLWIAPARHEDAGGPQRQSRIPGWIRRALRWLGLRR